MRAHIIETNASITPFDERVTETPILNIRLEDHQRRALSAAGAEPIEHLEPGSYTTGGPALVCTDDLYFTPELLDAFLEAARSHGGAAVLGVEEGPLTEYSSVLQVLGQRKVDGKTIWIFPLLYCGEAATVETRAYDQPLGWVEGADVVTVELDHKATARAMHRALVSEGEVMLPMGMRTVMRVTHWVHVLRANQLGLIAWGVSLMTREYGRLLWAVLRAMSINPHKVSAKITRRGKGCDIHPSAVVEASMLGDGVKIGANAVVRYCHLDDGVEIGDLCSVEFCVLGKGAWVSRTGMLQSCVLYPGSNTGFDGLQISVIGRDAFCGSNVLLADFNPAGNVMVEQDGEMVDVGTPLLGCAVGPKSRLLMGTRVAPGRSVPGGVTILGPTANILMSLRDIEEATAMIEVHEGGVRPLRSRRLEPAAGEETKG